MPEGLSVWSDSPQAMCSTTLRNRSAEQTYKNNRIYVLVESSKVPLLKGDTMSNWTLAPHA